MKNHSLVYRMLIPRIFARPGEICALTRSNYRSRYIEEMFLCQTVKISHCEGNAFWVIDIKVLLYWALSQFKQSPDPSRINFKRLKEHAWHFCYIANVSQLRKYCTLINRPPCSNSWLHPWAWHNSIVDNFARYNWQHS